MLIVLFTLLSMLGAIPMAAIAIPTQIWGLFSGAFWFAGVGLRSLLPQAIAPESVVPVATFTVLLGVLGSMIVGVVVFMEATANLESVRVPIIDLVLGSVVIFMSFASRDMPWVSLESGPIGWRLGADVVPGLGGLVSLVVLLLAGVTVIEVFLETDWSQTVIVVLGLFLNCLGILVIVMRGLFRRLATIGLSQLGLSIDDVKQIQMGTGPWLLVASGSSAVVFVAIRHYVLKPPVDNC